MTNAQRGWKGLLAGGLLAATTMVLGACGSSSGSSATSATSASTTVPAATTTAPTTTTTTPPTTTTPTTTPTTRPPIDGSEIDRLPSLPSGTVPPTSEPTTLTGQATFLRTVFADIQETWAKEFSEAGIQYRPARLVLFDSGVETGCGTQSSDVGPFYCGADSTVYLDQRFFLALEQKFGVTGDFAPAYVIAHEMGHHIQALLGISQRVATAEETDKATANAQSVRLELQADCFAGVWTKSTDDRKLLEPGDLDEALKAAGVVGDDFLAKVSGKEAEPEDWTHGTSAQRQHWLKVGVDSGKPEACDTFKS